jgi:NADH:ubiquinone oxidoreductase subunit 4 (subunit M)
MRFIGVALTMAAMAGCGLPGFLNFVGEVTGVLSAHGNSRRFES